MGTTQYEINLLHGDAVAVAHQVFMAKPIVGGSGSSMHLHSSVARALFGDKFVTGYCAVKTLELASFQSELSAWERRFLLPQV